MTSLQVMVSDGYSASALVRLRATPEMQITTFTNFDSSSLAPVLNEAQILLIRSNTRVNADVLDRTPQLRLVVTATSGFDHIDWRECQKRGVIAAYTPDANSQSTAELTLALLLAWERQLSFASLNVREGRWRQGLKRPTGLHSQTLGIVGLGRIGGSVAALAQAFGMHVIAYDPYVESAAFSGGTSEIGAGSRTHIEKYGLIELLRASDYVTLHVPLTSETRHLLNHATLKEMQSEAILINTCRGPVVDESDLLAALDEGTISGAAMDVIEREPPPRGHRILTHPKVLLTPHIGAYTDNASCKSSQEAVDKALRYAKGERISNTLPLNVPWFDKT